MACCSGLSQPVDDRCCVCLDETNYICLKCDLPVCNKCSTYENNEEAVGWMMGRSIGYCSACHKPEPKGKAIERNESKCKANKTVKGKRPKNFDVTDYAISTGR